MTEPVEEPTLTSSDVAKLFGVDPKTVRRWANAGKIPMFTTLGNHARFRESDVKLVQERGFSG